MGVSPLLSNDRMLASAHITPLTSSLAVLQKQSISRVFRRSLGTAFTMQQAYRRQAPVWSRMEEDM